MEEPNSERRPTETADANSNTASTAYTIVGLPGAGKSTAGQIVTEMIGGVPIETGDLVRRGARDHFDVESTDELTSDQLGDYSTMRRRRDGGDYVALDAIEYLEDQDRFPQDPAIVIGARDTETPPLFDEYFDYHYILWIHAPFETRLERLQERGRQDESEFTEDDLIQRDGRESMWGTPDIGAQADQVVWNTEDLDQLEAELDFTIELCENELTATFVNEQIESLRSSSD